MQYLKLARSQAFTHVNANGREDHDTHFEDTGGSSRG